MSLSTRVLVTGYGGFLGSEITRQLLHDGYQVNGLARNRYPVLIEQGVTSFAGDISDPAICQQAIAGCQAIIHTAAIAAAGGPRQWFERINIIATDVLLDAAWEAGCNVFVFCSSPSVVFDGKSQRNINESTPYPTRWLADYPRTKAIAEQHVLSRANANFQTCALRPHLIWGRNDNHLMPRLIDRARRGRLRIVGDGKNIIDTVHVEAAAQAHVRAMQKLLSGDPSINGKPFFLTDNAPIGCWDWINQILKTADQPVPAKRISLNAAYRIGHVLEIAYRLSGTKAEPPMTRFVALQMAVDHTYDISAARKLLNYEPIESRSEKLSEISDWLKTL